MSKAALRDLASLGQSIWLDNISRSMLVDGKLKSLIDQGLRGQTSNPTIFKQAICASQDYDAKIRELAANGKNNFQIYDELTVKDVADAADMFRSVYDKTNGLDGYVSLEINPQLANETQAQLNEGLRLFKLLNRPNVMIKVPATKGGLFVVEGLIAQGVNVNVTLIFSPEQYQDVVWAYIRGLQTLKKSGQSLSKVRSVASVFVSRIDAAVDKWIDEKAATLPGSEQASLKALRGRAAVSNSQIVYHKFTQSFQQAEFQELAKLGANVQRVLWASTATKDPQYSDVKYIEELIGPNTVNTVPDKTLVALMDHAKAAVALPGQVSQAQQVLDTLRHEGMDVGVLCQQLLQDGVNAFVGSFDELLGSITEKTKNLKIQV